MHDDAAIQMTMALCEAVSNQLNHELVVVDLHSIRHRMLETGQEDAARAIKLLILAAQMGR